MHHSIYNTYVCICSTFRDKRGRKKKEKNTEKKEKTTIIRIRLFALGEALKNGCFVVQKKCDVSPRYNVVAWATKTIRHPPF